MPQLLVAGKPYEWSLIAKPSEFTQLARLREEEETFDVLRITSLDSSFDVAIRVLSGKYSDGTHHFLGPMPPLM